MSRFQVHDEETAPGRSVTVLRGALSSGGDLPNVIGVLAGSPAALRAYARFRSELRHGALSAATHERIALAIAEHHGANSELELHARAARAAGLTLDEVARARRFDSGDARQAALLRYLQAVVTQGRPALHLHEEAREAGWGDEQIIEAIAAISLAAFTAMLTVAGEIPSDTPFRSPVGAGDAGHRLLAA